MSIRYVCQFVSVLGKVFDGADQDTQLVVTAMPQFCPLRPSIRSMRPAPFELHAKKKLQRLELPLPNLQSN